MSDGECVLYDAVDADYHAGEGGWSGSATSALIYPSRADAETALEDLDPERIIRDRVRIVPLAIAMSQYAEACEREARAARAMADRTGLTVHVLEAGGAICGFPGVPAEWPQGHAWVHPQGPIAVPLSCGMPLDVHPPHRLCAGCVAAAAKRGKEGA